VPVSAASTKVSTIIPTIDATTITVVSLRPRAKGIVFHEQEKEQEQAPTLIVSSQQPSQIKVQDKGKGKMNEPKPVKKLSKNDQLRLDEEIALRLQAEEEEEERLAREKAQKLKKPIQLGMIFRLKLKLIISCLKDCMMKIKSSIQMKRSKILLRRRAVSTSSGGISTASRLFSTAKESVSTAGASMPVSIAGMVQEVNINISSPVVIKDKGKGKMEESEDEQIKRTKLQQEQDRLGHEAVVRQQEELDEEERQRMARVHEAAQSFTEEEWENIRARVEADEDLSRRLQAEEMNKYSKVNQAKMLVDLINQRKKYFAAQKAEAKRNKPMTQAQQRNYMINYIKHMGSHTLQQLKRYSFDELKELFETTMKNVNTFVPMETEDRGRASELAVGSSQATIIDFAEVGSSKRAAEAELDHKGSKRQKTNEAPGSVQEQPEEEEKELSQEDLQQMMMVVPMEEVYVEALQDMLKIFDRDDLVMLWSLVKERFSLTKPTNDKERALWVELKRLFEPNTDDTLWKLQRYMHDPLKWRLYDTCGVHHVSTERGIDIFMLVEKEYPLSKGVLTLMLVNRLLVEQHSEMANELLRKIFIQANRPRQ
ncbi:hypothetical protein Tco_0587970, partial [Tanacetum coccineum]